jgi:hypothetical protein
MTVEIKQFNCPNCTTPLDLKNAGRSKSIVCPSCGSQIDLTNPGFSILGNVGQRKEPQVTPLKLGMRGTVGGQEYEIIGRVVYQDDEDDIWDEWLLLSAAGQYVWISDSVNEGMAMWHSFVPVNPIEPDQIQEDESFVLRKERVTVRDTGDMSIEYLEGELTWKAKVGDSVKYAEADSANERISIEYSQDEIEFYWGEDLDRNATAKAFGLAQVLPQGGTMRNAAPTKKGCFSGIGMIFVSVFCIALLCVGASVFGALGGSSSSQAAATLAPICTTPTAVAGRTPVPGPAATPSCFVPTRVPGSSSTGGFFGTGIGGSSFSRGSSSSSSSNSSIRSGSSGRSPSGGGGSRGGGK